MLGGILEEEERKTEKVGFKIEGGEGGVKGGKGGNRLEGGGGEREGGGRRRGGGGGNRLEGGGGERAKSAESVRRERVYCGIS